tara:strand:- start:12789 stop:14156 length:1368 start_codon:yes stop_codon:yes gene_type:complete
MEEPITLLCSPSQANTAKQCLRLWGFRYLDKIRSPSTASQAKGTALHTVGENWLRDGTVPPDNDIGNRFMSGIPHLPKPSPDLLVEHSFLFKDGDVHWRGFIDCVDPTGDTLVVLDHKSTKSFYWSMKPHQLKTDTQGIIYAKAMMDEYGFDVIEARWVYYLMEGAPASRKVSVLLNKKQVDQQYEKLKVLGEELLEIKKTKGSGLEIDVPFPNPGCRMFGGCEFGEICAAKEEGQEMSDLLSRLKKMKDNGVENNVQALHAAINPPTTVEIKPAPEPAPEPVETVACEDVPQVTKSRSKGRPKGSKNRKKVVDAPPQTPPVELKGPEKVIAQAGDVGVGTSTTLEAGVEGLSFTKSVEDTLVLYINCIPDNGATSVNKILESAAEQAASDNKVKHYRSIEYGQGAGALCVKLKELLELEEPLKGSYYMTTDNQLHKDALPALEALADQIVRGTR